MAFYVYGVEKMKNNLKIYHVLAASFFSLVLLIICLLCKNPLIIFGELVLIFLVIAKNGESEKLKRGFFIFIPFFIASVIINMIFAEEGKRVLFVVFGRYFTLEALIYSSLISIKLLCVIYIFLIMGMMVDSDGGVSYFSSIMPKSTMTLLIALKLVPNMKKRFENLKEIYSIRGVDYENKKLKEKIKSYAPVLSVLLENSLEGAFDIGESAYTRGFLSGKRSIYDKQGFKKRDYIVISTSILLIIFYILIKALGFDNFNIYLHAESSDIFNRGILGMLIIIFLITIILLKNSKGKKDGLY